MQASQRDHVLLYLLYALVFLSGVFFALIAERTEYYETQINFCNDTNFKGCVLGLVDAWRYIGEAEDRIQELSGDIDQVLILLTAVSSNLLLYLYIVLNKTFFGDAWYVGIIFCNCLMICVSIKNISTISNLLRIDFSHVILLCLLNPIFLFSVSTTNKEVFGFLLITLSFSAYLQKNRLLLCLLIPLGASIRALYAGFPILLLIRSFTNLCNPITVLLGISLAVPAAIIIFPELKVINVILMSVTWAETRGQASTQLMEMAAQLQVVPFGYILGFFIVFGVNAFSSAIFITRWLDHLSILSFSLLITQISSLMYFLFYGYFAFHLRRALRNEAFVALMLYVLVSSMLPISQHRYLFPIFPIAVIAFISLSSAGTARQNAPHSSPGGLSDGRFSTVDSAIPGGQSARASE